MCARAGTQARVCALKQTASVLKPGTAYLLSVSRCPAPALDHVLVEEACTARCLMPQSEDGSRTITQLFDLVTVASLEPDGQLSLVRPSQLLAAVQRPATRLGANNRPSQTSESWNRGGGDWAGLVVSEKVFREE